jgi:hypothetical protein
MASRSRFLQVTVAVLTALAAGCVQSPSPTNSEVFVGRYADNTSFQPFKNTSGANVAADATVCYPDTTLYCPDGGASVRVTVPGAGDPANAFAGGTFVSGVPRNLTGYDAVTFWAKSTRPAPIVLGLGNDNSGNSLYPAEWNTTLGTTWTQYVLPIPLPVKLDSEKGLFLFSAGALGSPAVGFTFWLAGIQYVSLGATLGSPTPVFGAACVDRAVGDAMFPFPSTGSDKIPVIFAVHAANQFVNASRRYFTFSSSDPAVATVDVDGRVSVQGAGTAVVSARLGGIEAVGPMTLHVNGQACPPLAVPTELAPTPTVPRANVISLFNSSRTYQDVPVDQWQTSWSVCCNDYVQTPITTPAGQSAVVKKYNLRAFAGISFGVDNPVPPDARNNAIDASRMTHFHLDVWTPNGFVFKVRLVNDPGQAPIHFQSESTVQVDAVSTPPLQTGRWVGVEIPMTDFINLGGTTKLGQMLFLVPDGTSGTFYVDNIYFHN